MARLNCYSYVHVHAHGDVHTVITPRKNHMQINTMPQSMTNRINTGPSKPHDNTLAHTYYLIIMVLNGESLFEG